MIKVCKFGGSSVSDTEQFKKVKNIICSDPSRKIVVVSAVGKRDSADHKVTDLLYLCHAHLTYGVPCGDILNTIRNRFIEIRNELGLELDIEKEFSKLESRLSKDFSVDELVSRGEYFTARLMAEYLGYHFLDAAECIFFGYDGQLDEEKTYSTIASRFSSYDKLVIPGFYGSLPNGRIKVMTRGGSDITGSLAAVALDADVYENWTDVSGILMADPRIVNAPSPIKNITYSELRELAFMGASILHEEAVQPVKNKGIPLNIRNTNRPADEGTMILPTVCEEEVDERFLTGIAGRKNFDILTFRKHNMISAEELRRALEIFDRFHVPVEHITLGLDSFALVASSSALGDSLYDIIADIQKTCTPDDLKLQDNIALVASVGRKMTYRPGTSGRIFKALGDAGINIRTIAQGADELAITVGVDNSQYEDAIRLLYEAFAV